MPGKETLEDFYRNKYNHLPDGVQNNIGNFNVFKVDYATSNARPLKYARREYYKILMIRGHHVYHYADKSLDVNGTALLFFNPMVPYTFERLSEQSSGYFCIFKEDFFSEHIRGSLKELPMYAPGGSPVYIFNQEQEIEICRIFEKMLEEIKSDYKFKYDLLRNYTTEMIHFALKAHPSEQLYQHIDAGTRLTTVFTELLERQFPIENVSQQFTMRSAKDYATQLNVHVNHLNRVVKNATGKTTTDLIAERLLIEAKVLLKHTDWNVSEISYCLGFEEPAHFNHFFKKQTNSTPSAFRV